MEKKNPDAGYTEVSILSDTLNPTLAKTTLPFFQIPVFFVFVVVKFLLLQFPGVALSKTSNFTRGTLSTGRATMFFRANRLF